MIVLSCGHEVSDLAHSHYVLTKATSREGSPAVACQMVCGVCEDQYRQAGEILDSQDAADAWLEQETGP